jgi:hypothetical protein
VGGGGIKGGCQVAVRFPRPRQGGAVKHKTPNVRPNSKNLVMSLNKARRHDKMAGSPPAAM